MDASNLKQDSTEESRRIIHESLLHRYRTFEFMIRKKVKKKCLTDRSYPQRRYHPLNSKDRVSREITGTFVKCKIRNASPRKWNKPRRAGVARGNGDGGGGGAAAAASRKRDARGEGNLLRVRLCVSFISTDIIMALRGRS